MSVTLVVTAASSLRERDAGAAQTLVFDQPRIVIGRGAHADVRLPSRAVSDTHAVIRSESGDLSVTDDASTNGTTVNGQQIVRGRKKVLRSGDRVGLPGFEITIESTHTLADPSDRTMAVARRLLADAIANAGGEAAPPELVLVTGRRAGQRWQLPKSGVQLSAGRGDICDIVLDDPDCSRQHARFDRDDVGVTVRDLESKNGVFVGGRGAEERRLRHGDEVQLGRSVLAFSDPAEQLLRTYENGPDEAPSAPAPTPPAPIESPPAISPSVESAPPVERNAATIPPPPGLVSEPTRSTAELETAPKNAAPQPRKRGSSTADWIVVFLAVVILGLSAVALYVLLHGGPGAH